MKKLLLALLLSPLSLFGATNLFNDVWMTSSLRMTFGAPALGKVLISDANGFAAWGTVGSAGGGDVFTQSNNVFGVTKTNMFNGYVLIGTNSPLIPSTGGIVADRGLFVRPLGNFAGANEPALAIAAKSSINDPHGVFLNIIEDGSGLNVRYSAGNIQYNGNQRFEIYDNSGSAGVDLASSSTPTGTNFFGFSPIANATATIIRGSTVSISSNLVVNGNFSYTGNGTFGDSSADTIIFNNSTATTPNTLDFNSGQFKMSTAGSNTMATALLVGPAGSFDSSDRLVVHGGDISVRAELFSSNRRIKIQSVDYPTTFQVVQMVYSGTNSLGSTYGITNVNLGSLQFQNVDNALIGINGAKPLIFATFSLERMRITSTGNVGIGTNSPSAKLHVAGSTILGTNGTSFLDYISGTAVLNFPSTAAGTESQLSISVPGTVSGDPAKIGVPFASAAGGGAFTEFTSNNTVWVRFSNVTVLPIDPASGTFRATVTHY